MRSIILTLVAFAALYLGASDSAAQTTASPSGQRLSSLRSNLEFIPNRGQLADQYGKPMPEVLYTLDGHGVKFYFTKNSMHYVFEKYSPCMDSEANALFPHPPTPTGVHIPNPNDTLSLYRVDVAFSGANPNVTIESTDKKSNYANFYFPWCRDGITRVPAYRTITYRNLYPLIDLVLAVTDTGMKYDFIVHPGGDPSAIRIAYAHASLTMDDDGSLHILTPFGEASEPAPIAYQEPVGINCHFDRSGDTIGFALGYYDSSRDLMIDPPRLWGTYFGGTGTDQAFGVAVDRRNNVSIAGLSNSPAGIATSGAFMTTLPNLGGTGFVATFDPDGGLKWATYYGGEHYDWFRAITCDTDGGKVCCGNTWSQTGIASSSAYQTTFGGGSTDGMIVSFDSAGIRRWGTYLGGTGDNDDLFGVAVDSSNHIVVCGMTSSDGLATANAFQSTRAGGTDGLLAKFSIDGVPEWITYFGTSATLDEVLYSIGCDASDHIYFNYSGSGAGLATPGAYQTTPGTFAIAKFFANGTRDWCTYYFSLGAPDYLTALAVGRTGNLYDVGDAQSPGFASQGAFQTSPAGGRDGYLVHFDSAGHFHWATYYGGSADDQLMGIAVDTDESMVAGGFTSTLTGLASPGEFQTSAIGSLAAPFIFRFDSNGTRRWATYYEDSGYVYGVTIDGYNHPVVAGWTNAKAAAYGSPGAHQTAGAGVNDAFVVRFCDTLEIPVTLAPRIHHICPGGTIRLSAGAGLARYQWSVNGVPIPGATSSIYSLPLTLKSGAYSYTVTGAPTDLNVCVAASREIRIIVGGATIAMPKTPEICIGDGVRILDSVSGFGRLTYAWSPSLGLDHADSAQPSANPARTTTYTLTVTDTAGCSAKDSVTVIVHSPPKLVLPVSVQTCQGAPVAITAGPAGDSLKYQWSPATDLDRTDSNTVFASPNVATTYVVTLTNQYGCMTRDSLRVVVLPAPKIDAGPPQTVCRSGAVTIGNDASNGIPPYRYQWSPASGLNDPTLARPTASPAVPTMYTVMVMDKSGCVAIDSVLIDVSDSLHPQIALSTTPTFCTGDTLNMSSLGYATYRWSTGETTPTIRVTTPGVYYVSVTNKSGCTGTSDAIRVNVLPDSVPHPAVTASAGSICEGDSVLLQTIKSYAGYEWSNGATASSIYVTKSGWYAVTASNSVGCSGTSDSVTVTVNAKPSLTLSALGATTFCEGDSVTLSATKGFTYEWQHDGVSLSNPSDQLTVKQSGSYTVIATNASGCSVASDTIVVTVKPRPVVTIEGPSSLCLGGTSGYRVNGASGGSILWQLNPPSIGTITGQGTDTITIDWENQPDAGMLTVTVESDGCEGTASLPITIDSKLSPQITTDGPLAFCDSGSVTLDAGMGYATYEWRMNGSPIVGRTSHDLTVSQSGTFTVFVTSAGGCAGESAPLNVTVYPAAAKPTISANGSTLTSTAAAHYSWLCNGTPLTDTTQSITADSIGDYVVAIVGANGCDAVSDPYHYGLTFNIRVHMPRNVIAAPGNSISIPLTLSGVDQLYETAVTSYAGIVRLPMHLATPVSPAGTRVGNDWLIPIGGPWVKGQTALQTLSLTASTIDPDCSDVTIDTFYFPNASIAVGTDIATVCVTGACHPVIGVSDTAFAMNWITPNPSEGTFTIRYHIAQDGPVELYVEDVLGRPMQYFVHESKPVGSYESIYSTTDLPAGLYRLVLQSAGRQRTAKVEFIK